MRISPQWRHYIAAGCLAGFMMSAQAQHDMGIDRGWPPVTCQMDVGSGLSITARPLLKGATLVGVTLAFSHAPDVGLRLSPSRITYYALPEGKPIKPVSERKQAPLVGAPGRITETYKFFFSSSPSTRNIAFAFGESAIVLHEDDRRNPIDTSFGIRRLMDVANVLKTPREGTGPHPCPVGLEGWKAKARLENRLADQDAKIGLEAAEEVLQTAAIAPPEQLILAAYHLWKDGRAQEASHWLAAGIYRASYSEKTGLGYGYYVGTALPIVDYARGRSPLWAESLRRAVQWDDKTYQQWEDEQEQVKKNRPTWLRNRAYQREDTLAYAKQLIADPQAPALNRLFPISPANALRQALEEQNAAQALAIVRSKAVDVNRQYPYDSSYLHSASGRGDVELIGALIEQGADTEATDNLGSTPLGWARNVKTLQALLDKGADINAPQGLDRQTLLLSLISNGTQQGLMKDERAEATARIALLLKAGADTNMGDSYGKTPLHVAAERGDVALVELLLEHGANIHAATKPERDRELANTPLAVAKDVLTATLLIRRGASFKPTDADAPLLYAAKAGSVEVVKFLLEVGSDPNSVGRKLKFNALFYAIARRDVAGNSIAELLVKNGADPNAVVSGKPLTAWAKDYGNATILRTLQQAGGE